VKKNIFKILFLVFLIGGFAVDSLAIMPEDSDRPPTMEQRERVRKRIETLKMWKLTKALDLDEKTSAQLFPLINKYDKKRAEIEFNIRDGMRELRKYLKENSKDLLKNVMAKLEQNNRLLQSINEEEWAELKKVLTIEQQANFILFRQEFDKDIRKIITNAKNRRHRKKGNNLPERSK
jgi:Spy/CpxP family protein refolding chaperone